MAQDDPRRNETAKELMAELRHDPEFMARSRETEQRLQMNRMVYAEAATQVLRDLADVGFPVQAVQDLRRSGITYRAERQFRAAAKKRPGRRG